LRIIQGQEPNHFLKLFKGKMVVHRQSFSNFNAKHTGLYDVRGTTELNVHAVECNFNSSSLHSSHVFILNGETEAYIWIGSLSNEHELNGARNITSHFQISRERNAVVIEIKEGEETAEFWTAIGSAHEYYNPSKLFPSTKLIRFEPRLFRCSNATGVVKVDEEIHISQDSLDSYCVWILDTFYELYVFFGSKSKHIEKKIALETVQDYVKESSIHDKNTPIFVVLQSSVCLTFTAHFQGWDGVISVPEKSPLAEILKDFNRTTYSYEELLSSELPTGVDATKLEFYLSDEEFQTVFHMTRSEYEKIPEWKRGPIKQKVYLF